MSSRSNKIEAQLSYGPWPEEIRGTFRKVTPVLDKLQFKFDRRYILYLLRELTWIVKKWPAAEDYRRRIAWKRLCEALDELHKLNGDGQLLKEYIRMRDRYKGTKEGKSGVVLQPENLWEPGFNKFLTHSFINKDAFEQYQRIWKLLSPQEAITSDKRGKRTAFWSNAIATAMTEHFQEKTGFPQWAIIGKLLSSSPKGLPFAMGREQIRKRLVAAKSEDKLLGERKPTTSGMAYEFKRQYDKWVKAGAKGSCPSLILSIFKKPEFDTSFPEETLTKIVTDLHKKYRQKNDE